MAQGNMYEGHFVQSMMHGKGKFTWANGDMYEGGFVDDKKTGKAKYTWSNGYFCYGDFVNGQSKMTFADGHVEYFSCDDVNEPEIYNNVPRPESSTSSRPEITNNAPHLQPSASSDDMLQWWSVFNQVKRA